jgi:putative lipoprotein
MTTPGAVVRGRIRWPSDTPTLEGATVTVRVEDVSRADASSMVVGEQVLRDVTTSGTTAPELTFEVPVAEVDERAHYAVSVHVDRSGSGTITKGDLLSVQSHPVLTRGHPWSADVSVVVI